MCVPGFHLVQLAKLEAQVPVVDGVVLGAVVDVRHLSTHSILSVPSICGIADAQVLLHGQGNCSRHGLHPGSNLHVAVAARSRMPASALSTDLADVELAALFTVEGLAQLAPAVEHQQQPLPAARLARLRTASPQTILQRSRSQMRHDRSCKQQFHIWTGSCRRLKHWHTQPRYHNCRPPAGVLFMADHEQECTPPPPPRRWPE